MVLLIAGTLGFRWASAINTAGARQLVHWNHKVYIAFGFHGNLYHSFRGDTNDETGFGRDIRIIRHIINTLDRFNEQGVPVRASWEFDNHFSLEQRLPRHAPDILENLKRRISQGRDEVLLMSYNNGLASAMTRQELEDSIHWAVTNPWGSGVRDIFGTYTPIVRPQEMMTTPGNFDIYRSAGIQAVSLYYSATPFDTFRVFSRALSQTEAHNPLTYKNDQTGEEILVIPTYNIGDLVENVSLGNWVEGLHQMQRRGQIRKDLLLFINFDADSAYWTGTDRFTWPVNQLPNTQGLRGLINEVKNRNYVRFTTLKDYLADHGPAGSVRFHQDTADGSFDGYNSWSEKLGSTRHWTRIMAARRIYRGAEKAIALLGDPALEKTIRPLMDEAYMLRLKAMSTTNFGMATPFVAPGREQVMAQILDRLDHIGTRIEQGVHTALKGQLAAATFQGRLPRNWVHADTLFLASPAPDSRDSRFITLSAAEGADPDRQFRLIDAKGETYGLTPLPGTFQGKTRFHIDRPARDGVYRLCSAPRTQTKQAPVQDSRARSLANRVLEAGDLAIRFSAVGRPDRVTWKGEKILEPAGLTPYLRYKDNIYAPARLKATRSRGPATEAVHLTGTWPGPKGRTLSDGWVRTTFSTVKGLPYLFVDAQVRYPATADTEILKADIPGLARPADMGWQEAAPIEFRLAARASKHQPVKILKTNYLNVHTAYDLDYFRHSRANLDLDNVNNHITAGWVGMAAGGRGLALSYDQSVAANFAGAPVKVRYNREEKTFSAGITPFGTFHGRQNQRPTWGNGQGHDAALISGEQYYSAAPTYNGQTSRFSLMVGFFKGSVIPEHIRRDLRAHANPALVFSLNRSPEQPGFGLSAPTDIHTVFNNDRITISWKNKNRASQNYRLYMGTRPGKYTHSFLTDQTWLTLAGLSPHQPFRKGQRYYAVIEAIGPHGTLTARTDELRLDILPATPISAEARIPWQFPLKILWSTLKASVL